MAHANATTVLALAVWFWVPVEAAAAPPVRDLLKQYMERIAQRGFSGAVLIARDGHVILSNGYGKVGMRGGEVTADTVFDVASVTKQFTAAAILKLEMQGKIKTTDSISRVLDGVPNDKQGITIHHLLTHTAGIRDNFGGDYDVAPRDETVRKILAAPLESAPGEQYGYSNAGYSLLGALIEIISGISWEQFARKHLFEPVGMKATGYRPPRWKQTRVAQSFLPVRYPSPLDRPGPYWNLIGNGGVLSTVGDLYKWHKALQGDDVLSAAAAAKLFVPYVPERPGARTSYGYGWVIQKTPRGTALVWHNGGSDEGFTSYIGRYVDENAVIIVLSNSVLSGSLLPIDFLPGALENILFGGDYALPPPMVAKRPSDLDRYQATYRMPSGGTVSVSAKDGKLLLESQGRDAVSLLMYPEADRAASPLTARITEVFDALSRDDFGPLEEMAGPQAASDHKKRFAAFWSEWQLKLGRYGGTRLLFTMPTGSRVSTYIELKFDRGTQVIRAAQRDGGPVSFTRGGVPARTSFLAVPSGGAEFSYFDFRSGKNIAIQLPTKEYDEVSEMVLRLTPAEVRVPAIKPEPPR